jgi:hypothetical protein
MWIIWGEFSQLGEFFFRKWKRKKKTHKPTQTHTHFFVILRDFLAILKNKKN